MARADAAVVENAQAFFAHVCNQEMRTLMACMTRQFRSIT